MPIWEEQEGAPRRLNKLQTSVLSKDEEGECLIDAMGNSHCNHWHPSPTVLINDMLPDVVGWTAQGTRIQESANCSETIVRPMGPEDRFWSD